MDGTLFKTMKALSLEELQMLTGQGEAAVADMGQFVGGYYKGLFSSGGNIVVAIVSGFYAAATT
jgi:hypothetical protein